MENKQPLLSLCIPTNGIVEWVIPVIKSIYVQGIDNNLFEVVITDNGGKEDIAEAIKQFDYPNLRYYQTTSLGFTNQIDAFEKCNGVFCKMLNHRTQMREGSLSKIIEIVKRYKEKKPLMYFSDGNAKGNKIIECKDMNQFVDRLSYWVSWSSGTSAWREDIAGVRGKKINKMFPHVVFLFDIRDTAEYVIWNENYLVKADDSGKGGYNLFETFGVELLDLLNDLRRQEKISIETFVKVKNDLYNKLCYLYRKEVIETSNHNFILTNIPKSMSVYYGSYYYYKMKTVCWTKYLLINVKKILTFGFLKRKKRKV